jgi:hypothetical protein
VITQSASRPAAAAADESFLPSELRAVETEPFELPAVPTEPFELPAVEPEPFELPAVATEPSELPLVETELLVPPPTETELFKPPAVATELFESLVPPTDELDTPLPECMVTDEPPGMFVDPDNPPGPTLMVEEGPQFTTWHSSLLGLRSRLVLSRLAAMLFEDRSSPAVAVERCGPVPLVITVVEDAFPAVADARLDDVFPDVLPAVTAQGPFLCCRCKSAPETGNASAEITKAPANASVRDEVKVPCPMILCLLNWSSLEREDHWLQLAAALFFQAWRTVLALAVVLFFAAVMLFVFLGMLIICVPRSGGTAANAYSRTATSRAATGT